MGGDPSFPPFQIYLDVLKNFNFPRFFFFRKITADLVVGTAGRKKLCGPMKSYLSIPDLAMWIVLIAGKVMLCLCILKKHFFGRLPIFSALIFFLQRSELGTFCSRVLGQLCRLLPRSFYISGHIESALIFLTLVECGRQVLSRTQSAAKRKGVGLFAGCNWQLLLSSFSLLATRTFTFENPD